MNRRGFFSRIKDGTIGGVLASQLPDEPTGMPKIDDRPSPLPNWTTSDAEGVVVRSWAFSTSSSSFPR